MASPPSSVRLQWQGRSAPIGAPVGELRSLSEGSRNSLLIEGDNLTALEALRTRFKAEVTLAYLDPPFLTGRQHHRITRHRGPAGVVRALRPAFDDRWRSLDHYLAELDARLRACRALLAPHGCLVLHVDTKTSHYAKVLCDEIFGSECFASEIVWRYRRWPSKTANFQRVHDVLLRYVRDPDAKPRFTQLYEPLAASTQATWKSRRQRAVVNAEGRRCRSSKTQEESPGAPLGDVWDISIVAPVAKERTGYPTQKPRALLDRLIEACTTPGDLVLDPYVGSGTTLAAALDAGRRCIGIDLNPEALEITTERLKQMGVVPQRWQVAQQTTVESTSSMPTRVLATDTG